MILPVVVSLPNFLLVCWLGLAVQGRPFQRPPSRAVWILCLKNIVYWAKSFFWIFRSGHIFSNRLCLIWSSHMFSRIICISCTPKNDLSLRWQHLLAWADGFGIRTRGRILLMKRTMAGKPRRAVVYVIKPGQLSLATSVLCSSSGCYCTTTAAVTKLDLFW